SWQVERGPTGETRFAAPTAAPSAAPRGLGEAMTLPLLGELSPLDELSAATPGDAPADAAPGMIANRAQAWSVAQSRSSADLAFDFVPPELVLAARVYGLGPAEAAHAARLAIAGPSQLGAIASTLDRTLVQAMAIEADRRGEAI